MKIDSTFSDRMRNISEKEFLDFYCLIVDISLIIHNPDLKLYMYIENSVVEGNVSQYFDKGPSSFSVKSRKDIQRKIIKSYKNNKNLQK